MSLNLTTEMTKILKEKENVKHKIFMTETPKLRIKPQKDKNWHPHC